VVATRPVNQIFLLVETGHQQKQQQLLVLAMASE